MARTAALPMNPNVEVNLALILFLPWYAILGALYWFYPRQPKSLSRWVFDVGALTVATIATALSMHWSYRIAGFSWGAMWPQILATSVSYGVFLAVMTAAWCVRRQWIVLPFLRRGTDGASELPSLPEASP